MIKSLSVGSLIVEKNVKSNNVFMWLGEIIKNSYYENDFYVFHYINDLKQVAYINEDNFEVIK